MWKSFFAYQNHAFDAWFGKEQIVEQEKNSGKNEKLTKEGSLPLEGKVARRKP